MELVISLIVEVLRRIIKGTLGLVFLVGITQGEIGQAQELTAEENKQVELFLDGVREDARKRGVLPVEALLEGQPNHVVGCYHLQTIGTLDTECLESLTNANLLETKDE